MPTPSNNQSCQISYIYQNKKQQQKQDINTSFLPDQLKQQQDEEQIKPDTKNQQSIWLNDDQTETQSSDKNHQQTKDDFYNVLAKNNIIKKQQNNKQQQVVKRGNNRGNRGNRDTQKQQQKQQQQQTKQNNNKNSDHQLPSQQNKQRGNRRRGQPSRPQQNNDYGGFKKPYNRDYNNNNRDYNNNYEKRPYNRNYNQKGYETQTSKGNQSKNQDQKVDQTTYKNRNYQQRNNYNPNNNGFKKKYFNNNDRPYGQRNNNYNKYNTNQYDRKPQPIIKQIIKQVTKQIQVIKYMDKIVQVQKPRPAGRRVQPQVSIYLKGCLLTLTCRRLQKFKADILVMPFKTTKLELYPGNLVTACQIDYKDKIKKKGEQLEKQGAVYLQKCIGIKDFQGFMFMKIGDPEKSTKQGIINMLQALQLVNKKFSSIIFPISKSLGPSKYVIKTFIEQIQKYKFLKDVYITTQEKETFCEAVTAFNQIFAELFQENQISIN